MKKVLLLIVGFIFSLAMIAQGKKTGTEKKKDQSKNEKMEIQGSSEKNGAKEKKEQDEHYKKVWAGVSAKPGNGSKLSKNQPAKVTASFQKDYPNAANVSWSKYHGDWTATFRNAPFISTAVYHANGERRDTRTTVTKNEVPRNVLDSIFKRRPAIQLGDIIKIEVPNSVDNIFRIKDLIQGKTTYFYYNSNGQLVKYNY